MKYRLIISKIAFTAFLFITYNISAANEDLYIKNNSTWDIEVQLTNMTQTIPAGTSIRIGDTESMLPNIVDFSIRRIGAAEFLSRLVSIDVDKLKIRSWLILAKEPVDMPRGYKRNLYWTVNPTTFGWDAVASGVVQKQE